MLIYALVNCAFSACDQLQNSYCYTTSNTIWLLIQFWIGSFLYISVNLRHASALISAEAGVTPVLCCRTVLAKECCWDLRCALAPISAEAFSEIGCEWKFALKNGDFLIASKMRSIHFSKFLLAHPKMIHRAPFCATFWRQKVAKRMFDNLRTLMLW